VPIREILGDVLKGTGLEKAIRQIEVMGRWKDIMGETLAKNAVPVDIRDGILFLRAPSAAWRTQLHAMKGEIIKKINASAKKRIIHTVHFCA
jgi:predicted nucleic acid-binding Zn ribbon protein